MKTPVMLTYIRISVFLLTSGSLVIGQTPTPTHLPNTTTTGQQNASSTAPLLRIDSQCTPYMVQNNVNGANIWNRSWSEYKVGFNTTAGDFWIGNELLYQLTSNNRYKLHIDLLSADNSNWYWAEYSSIMVGGEGANYPIYVAGFTSNTASDALDYHNSMMFSTYDRDNDQNTGNCAADWSGGFWYNYCAKCSLNAPLGGTFRWLFLTGNYYMLKSSRMWLLC